MISLIVCTYNRDKFIYQTLEHIAVNQFPEEQYEIVLVNNNCTDNTEAECNRFQQNFPSVNLRYFVEIQQGLSFARNRGIQEASGDILVFLDDDAFVCPNYLSLLTNYLQQYPDAMAFGGKIDPLFESGITPAWLCKWTYSWVSAINKGKKVVLFEGNSYPIGANMGFQKDCITQCGTFNTALGRSKKNLMAGEEKDLFNRVKAAGMKIYYFPDLAVQHVIPPGRTTDEYLTKMGIGVGMSERVRCMNIGKAAYYKRCFSEFFKWAVSLVLWVVYLFRFTPIKGNKLINFRWNVTKGLINSKID